MDVSLPEPERVGTIDQPTTRVLLISGSLRSGSTNTALLRTAMTVAPDGIIVELYDGMGALPHFNPDGDREGESVDAAVAELRAAIGASDALLFCTPEYAGALPGSFKNLLEWTVGDGGTYDKPVAWINASGPAAPSGGEDAHDSLCKVLGYVGADIVEAACARIETTRDAIGSDGTFGNPAMRGHVRRILTALAEHATDRGETGMAATEGTNDPLEAVARADDAFFAALLDGRGPVIEDLLTDDFLIVEVQSGSVVDRGDFVAAIANGHVTFDASEAFRNDRIIRGYGDVAVVIGRTRMSFTLGDASTFRSASRYTHVFRRVRGRWRMISAQGTAVPRQ